MAPEDDVWTERPVSSVDEGRRSGVLAVPDDGVVPLSPQRRLRSSVALLGLILVVAAAATAGGWWLGSRVKSPEQIAAESAPPTPSLVTAPVEFRELADRIVVRGTLVAPEETEVTVGVPASGAPIVTRVPVSPGEQLTEGTVVLEVSGRPVFAVSGSVPAYRDLNPGDDGPDVIQLQEALGRLGYTTGDIDGVYGTVTQEAVASMYRDAGYEPAATDAGDQLDAAHDRVDAAARSVRDAQAAVGAAKAGSPTAVAQAEANLAAAVQALADAIAKADLDATEQAALVDAAQRAYDEMLADPDATQADIDAAYLALVSAQTTAERIRLDNDAAIAAAEDQVTVAEIARDEAMKSPDLTAAKNALSDANAELADARSDLAEAIAAAGLVLPSAEIVIVASLPAEVTTLDAPLGGAPGSPTITLVTGAPVAEALLTGPERQLIDPGDPVLIESTAAGLTVQAHVVAVAAETTTNDAGLSGFVATIEPDVEPLASDLAGHDVQLTITAITADEAVLVVPIAAVVAQGDGTPRITVVPDVGPPIDVTVTIGRTAAGYAEITPHDYQLMPGDLVRIPTQ